MRVLRERLAAEGVPGWDRTLELAHEFGLPHSRVVREALQHGAREGRGDSSLGVALLVECARHDEDSGGWSTGRLLVRVAKGPDPASAVNLMDDLLDLDVRLPVEAVGEIADALATAGRRDLVERCFDYLQRTGTTPNAYLWSALLRAQAVRGEADAVVATFAQIPEPSPIHLNIVVGALAPMGRGRDTRDAIAAFEGQGKSAKVLDVARCVAALVEESASSAITYLRDRLAAGNRFSPAMLAPILGALRRGHEVVAAVTLWESLVEAANPLSERNAQALLEIVALVRDPDEIDTLAERLRSLLDDDAWARLLAAVAPRPDNVHWLAVAPSSAINLLDDRTFSALLRASLAQSSQGSTRRLLDASSRPMSSHYSSALDLASVTGDTEMARSLIASMFEKGITPDEAQLTMVARTYSGTLERVEVLFNDLLGRRTKTDGHGLARTLVAAVLTTYAETNQSDQFPYILAKFEGWPPLKRWSDVWAAVLAVASRRPSQVPDAVGVLEQLIKVRLGPARVAEVALAAARSGQRTGTRAVLLWANAYLQTSPGRRSVDFMRLAQDYEELLELRPRPTFLPTDRTQPATDGWLPNVHAERRLVAALTAGRRDEIVSEWRSLRAETAMGLPSAVLLRLVEHGVPDAGETRRILDLLRHRPDVADDDVRAATDGSDRASGRASDVVERFLNSSDPVTPAAALCYVEANVPEGEERYRAIARYRAALPSGHKSDVRALMRCLVEYFAHSRQPEKVRRVMLQLAPRALPDVRLWALLQAAYGDDVDAVRGVIEEMRAVGVEPGLVNRRAVVSAFAGAGQLADAVTYVAGIQGALTVPESAALLGDVVAAAANVDDLALASSVRDRVLALPAALPPGALRALDTARRRAGDHEPRRLVSAEADETIARLSTFVRDVAHDLHNDLSPIWAGMASIEDALLQDDVDLERINGALRTMTSARTTVKQLLDHWNAVAEDDAASGETADVARVVGRLAQLLTPGFAAVGARLEYTMRAGTFLVHASPYQLDLALRQLLNNSLVQLKKVPEASRVVSIRAVDVESLGAGDDEHVLVSVTDTGPGIDPAHRKAVFEHGFSTRTERGVGRGLALVSEIVDACDGAVLLDSRTAAECTGDQTPFTEFRLYLRRAYDVGHEGGEPRND